MSRTITLNYAEVTDTSSVINADGSVTIVAAYVVGYKPAVGPVLYLSHPSFAGPSEANVVTVNSAATDTHQQSAQAVIAAIAVKENLNIAGGDTVQLLQG